ncbi:L-histidine N(alpha)-methyltransferase [Xenophilus arseniciresistens]|uniref:L-histidine N(Alpha)-methyltransferase n=1 Tax=Xenophilus arseniciresistens TaxID=1283306 RepID=A0AAE3ND28_9BURK|nr:L-histidine N(alpha)-methyltransferase [Xenophilus arseniciresistens]MDA7417389.1 L-histidine N(alpha)-methyltransferase [Xenophilus arseniciresistens]
MSAHPAQQAASLSRSAPAWRRQATALHGVPPQAEPHLHEVSSAPSAEQLARQAFARDLVQALDGQPRRISPKYFYDAAGSQLFDRICELPEYYPTRTELAILSQRAGEIARHIGPDAEIVEFGAGSLHKVRLLLDALPRAHGYVPIDISGEHLAQAAQRLRAERPGLAVRPVVADYSQPMRLPEAAPGVRRVGFFPGSTLGNFDPAEAQAFLSRAAQLLRGGGLLLGVDLVKDPAVLHAAYNDSQRVTAAFNRNLLLRANAELGADFDVDAFAHSAFYNAPLARIEMHLQSLRAQTVHIGGVGWRFEEGETLHTENSHKFSVEGLRALALRAGFGIGPVWTDPERLFSVHWLPAAQ